MENKDSILFPQGYAPMMYLYGQQFYAIPPAIACRAFFSALMSSFLKMRLQAYIPIFIHSAQSSSVNIMYLYSSWTVYFGTFVQYILYF